MANEPIYLIWAIQGEWDDRISFPKFYYNEEVEAQVVAAFLNEMERYRILNLEETGKIFDEKIQEIDDKFGYTEENWLDPHFEASGEYWDQQGAIANDFNLDPDIITYYVKEVKHG